MIDPTPPGLLRLVMGGGGGALLVVPLFVSWADGISGWELLAIGDTGAPGT